ncbi:MAG TPA: DUF4177 domain-containing protein [Myxococcota bacterium]|nr:DUF4177 domain-containing protein [Myxococcota bacterium]
MALQYKVVETSSVSDEELERILNEFVSQGWSFEGFHFAMRESSKRPSMAFVTFTRPDGPAS